MSAVTSVIGQFLHPPVGVTRLEQLPNNPYSGFNVLSRPRGLLGVDAFGLRYIVQSAPPGYGLVSGAAQGYYDRSVIDLAVLHQMLDGNVIVSAEASYRVSGLTVMFEQSFPYRIQVQLAPGVTANFWWILLLGT
jgi:hypothetical protein